MKDHPCGGQGPSSRRPASSTICSARCSRSPSRITAQLLLASRGYQVDADGSFGPRTRTAVVQFQKSRSLAADGVIGPHTWSKLVQVVKHGSSGQAVRAAQTQLNVYGYGLKTDGSFGANTKSAVTAFQKKHRLQVDGVVGPQTWRTLLGTR
ncbi:peptidoglycan hydrolase-like protein with peptidoglycan-binding domain [Streptomyces filamentosus]